MVVDNDIPRYGIWAGDGTRQLHAGPTNLSFEE